MSIRTRKSILAQTVSFLTWSWLLMPSSFAASPSPAMLKAKQEAESKGYVFVTNHDEIVATAKKEGKVRVLANMEPSNIRANTAAFKKKYPFIDIYVHDTGSDVQRLLLEIQSGAAKEWDVIPVSPTFRSEYDRYLWNVDLLGMATQGVLAIPSLMIDQKYGNVLAAHSLFQVTAYNTKFVSPDSVPKTWEDLLAPEWKGRKFAADIQTRDIATLVPAWGLEKTVDFARKITAQQPIWVRGGTRTLTSMLAGEIPMLVGPNFQSVKRVQRNDRAGMLQYVILEPVPIRLGNAQAILATSHHRHAALLWLEWLASPESQKITDETEPFSSSVHVRGGVVEQELRGKKLSIFSWEHYHDMQQWEKELTKAYGFPNVDPKR